MQLITLAIAMTILVSFLPAAFAGDLDDGIKIDTPINDDLGLDTNVQYIKLSATARARNKAGDSDTLVVDGCSGIGNVNVAPDSKIKTIIIAGTFKNNTAVCDQKK